MTALVEREAIRELVIRYCHCVWNRDLAVIDLFASDGRFNENRGHEGIGRYYRAAFASQRMVARPYAANHFVELHTPEHATGVCHADIRLKLDGRHVQYIGAWTDEYRKVGGAWRFQARDFALAYQVDLGPAS